MFIYGLIDPDTNLIRYIGKTKNSLIKRLNQHIYKTKLKDGKLTHKENWIKKLLSDGKKPTIKLLEEVNQFNWKERERYYIKTHNNLTNIQPGGEGGSNPSCFRKVAKLDYISMKIISKYESLAEAERKNNIKYTLILESCKGRKTKIGGYVWRYLDEENNIIDPIEKSNLKKVGQFTLSMDLIRIYENAKETGYEASNINHCCNGKVRTAYGYIWRHLDINNNTILPEIKYKFKTISLLDDFGNIKKVYENANQASLDGDNLNSDLILRVCRDKATHHKGKKYKFNEY